MISSSQKPLPDNIQHSQKIYTFGGIRTHILSRRTVADLHLRPLGHWDRLMQRLMTINGKTSRAGYLLPILKRIFLHNSHLSEESGTSQMFSFYMVQVLRTEDADMQNCSSMYWRQYIETRTQAFCFQLIFKIFFLSIFLLEFLLKVTVVTWIIFTCKGAMS